ncbi:MAG: hypothetical protein ACFCU8_21320 [Thermosynechococcaceae cyanobacterium]
MSQILTVELNEQVFAAIKQQAQTMGISPAALVAALLEQQSVHSNNGLADDVEKDAARARFEHHFGTLDAFIDLDNESIDSDLVKEYASTHE